MEGRRPRRRRLVRRSWLRLRAVPPRPCFDCENVNVTGLAHDGGYATMIAPAQPSAHPRGLRLEAGPLLCAGVTTFNALRNTGAHPGDLAACRASAGSGHLGVQFAAKMGFRTSIAITRGGADKVKLARDLGAHEVIDLTDTGPVGRSAEEASAAPTVYPRDRPRRTATRSPGDARWPHAARQANADRRRAVPADRAWSVFTLLSGLKHVAGSGRVAARSTPRTR